VRVLVGYASKHGGTAEIADAVGASLRQAGLEADVVPLGDVVEDVDYDAFVLGSALYAGSWLREALRFVDRHAETIADRPCWLFSSGPLGEPAELAEEQPAELGDLTARLRPRWHTVFPGRYDPDLVGFGEGMIMKAVKAEPGDYRDWETIGRWAREIAAELTTA
jgi:menaquinone-dependent protoporphyrinogen oxidase